MPTNNAINTGKPIEVSKGGTGVASNTAYSVLCGGTTTTNPIQSVASVGTSGQVLTSTGPGSLPTWQPSGVGTGFAIVYQVFTSNGVYIPSFGMKYCDITCIGGGGGGGSAFYHFSTVTACGSGGGGGEYAQGIFTAATIGTTQSITIGTGGSGGNLSAGNAGGTTSVGALISAGGGGGGLYLQVASNDFSQTYGVLSGPGGTGGTGGDFRCRGMIGKQGFMALNPGNGQNPDQGGEGANTQFGCGGPDRNNSFASSGVINGINGAGYGAGGGGASCPYIGGTVGIGGSGSSGIVIIKEYCTA